MSVSQNLKGSGSTLSLSVHQKITSVFDALNTVSYSGVGYKTF